MTRLSDLERRRDRALDDLADLARQIEAGEIDATTAADLRARYEAEAADALHSIDQWTEPASQGLSRRTWWGIGIAAVAVVAVVLGVASAIEPRQPGGFATGGDPSVVTPSRDLSDVTNEELEQVVAENPDITPMRLALARRYVEDGDFSAALPHYLTILEREEDAEALAYVGWMTYLSGDVPTGAAYLERSLDRDPNFTVAQWFLANLRFYGQDDPAAAAPLLEAVIASDDAPPEIVAEAEAMLRGGTE